MRAQFGALIGALPCYLKNHSQGEYVFDHSWADAFERAGGRYYPKLQCSVPFTPATGPRLLAQDAAHRKALLTAVRDEVLRLGLSSLGSQEELLLSNHLDHCHQETGL